MRLPDLLRERAAASGLLLGPEQDAAVSACGALQDGRVDGLYLHGPPGRGKTWVLDGVALSWTGAVRRLHGAQLATRLDAELGPRLHLPDRLVRALDAVLGDARLLCLDELQVDVPDDAGLVHALLTRAAERRCAVLVTSNTAPDQLLPDPAAARWAAGLLDLLARRWAVRRVDDGIDHRRHAARDGGPHGLLLTPAQVPRPLRPAGLVSGGRPLPVVRAGGELWARFSTLLGVPTGRADYLLLAAPATAVGLLDVPDLTSVDADTRARFAVLVDVLHDAGVPLHLVLRGQPDWSLLPERTASRLSLLRQASGTSSTTSSPR